MTPIKLSELERLSKQATPGEWRSDKNPMRDDGKFLRTYYETSVEGICSYQLDPNTCDYIAAAQPLTISRLCEALRIAYGALRMYENVALKCIDPELPDINFAESGIKKINALVDLS